MTDMRKVFYTVVLPNGRERKLLDAIRLFARPATRHPAHITLQGPFEDYIDPRNIDPRALSAAVHGLQATVGGVGEFRNVGKTAIFLHVDAPELQAYKNTPSFPDSPTHVTLYDGDSPDFAERLKQLMMRSNVRFTFTVNDVEPMVPGNGEYPLRALYESSDLEDVMEHPPTPADVDSADETTRLRWIEELASHFAKSG